jgi:hypothetical protein
MINDDGDDDDCGATGGMNEWRRKPKFSVHHRSHMT